LEHIALIVTLLSRCCNEDFIDVFPIGFSEVLHPSRVTSGVLEDLLRMQEIPTSTFYAGLSMP